MGDGMDLIFSRLITNCPVCLLPLCEAVWYWCRVCGMATTRHEKHFGQRPKYLKLQMKWQGTLRKGKERDDDDDVKPKLHKCQRGENAGKCRKVQEGGGRRAVPLSCQRETLISLYCGRRVQLSSVNKMKQNAGRGKTNFIFRWIFPQAEIRPPARVHIIYTRHLRFRAKQ